MENTSKVLLIAAAVLIAIVIITLGITMLNSSKNVKEDATDVSEQIENKSDTKTDFIKDSLDEDNLFKYSSTAKEKTIPAYLTINKEKQSFAFKFNEEIGTEKKGSAYGYYCDIEINEEMIGKIITIAADFKQEGAKLLVQAIPYKNKEGVTEDIKSISSSATEASNRGSFSLEIKEQVTKIRVRTLVVIKSEGNSKGDKGTISNIKVYIKE